jgi:exopolysaccharide production protein ExoY
MNSLSDTRTDLPFESISGRAAPVGLSSKRFIDIVLASCGIILLAPLLLMCVLLTWASSGGPAVFRHRRVGFGGKQFDCLKFRTMVADASERLRQHLESDPAAAAEWASTQKLRDDPRVTFVGALLRKSSLDELPQLFNVLKGEMSLVGPRPHAVAHNQLYCERLERYANRHCVKPGMTGWAQIHGFRGPTEDPEKMRKRVHMDLYYIENWSIWLDLKIIALTPFVGFVHRNAF